MTRPPHIALPTLGALACALALHAALATAADFTVRPGGENKVVFRSRATMDSFEGKTKKLAGRLTLDPAALGDSIGVHLEVDMASLDTGIAKRNQHMRNDHLQTDRYPLAIFDGASIRGPAAARLDAGQPVSFEVEGTFKLHGISRRIHFTIDASYSPAAGGGRIAFHTVFPVSLSDYGISRPEFLFMRLAEVQQVTVSGVAIAAP